MLLGLGGAVVLAAATVGIARVLARGSRRREELVLSFVAGVGVTFVVLELFVELAGGEADVHDIVRLAPEPLQTVSLVFLGGLVLFFFAHVRASRAGDTVRAYVVAAVPQIAFAAIVGAALVEEGDEDARSFALFLGAMSLHLGAVEHGLEHSFAREHRGLARAIFAAAPIFGAIGASLVHVSPAAFQLLLALIAGSVLFVALREEIPEPTETRLGAFLAGVIVYGALIKLRWWL